MLAISIATISTSVNRPYTEKIKPPRSIFLRWPFGHPLGEPDDSNQKAAVLNKAFEALYAIDTLGKIIDVGWRWRQETNPEPGWFSFFNSLMHGIDVTHILRMDMPLWEIAMGFAGIFIMGWLMGATIAGIYNLSILKGIK